MTDKIRGFGPCNPWLSISSPVVQLIVLIICGFCAFFRLYEVKTEHYQTR